MIPAKIKEKALEWKGFQSFQLVTFEDIMRQFRALGLANFMTELKDYEEELLISAPNREPTSKETAELLDAIGLVKDYCEFLGLDGRQDSVLAHVVAAQSRLNNTQLDIYGRKRSTIGHDFRAIRLALCQVLHNRKFLYLSPEESEYFEQPDLFGIKKAFPTANAEIKDAGTCYSSACYTACVFHLMRAVEIGARVLVEAMKAQKHLTTFDKQKRVQKPVELCDWKTVYDGLQVALSAFEHGKSRNLAKSELHSYLNEAIINFKNFKDAWRNPVSHGHKQYRKGAAKDILDSTERFIKHLSIRLQESRGGKISVWSLKRKRN